MSHLVESVPLHILLLFSAAEVVKVCQSLRLSVWLTSQLRMYLLVLLSLKMLEVATYEKRFPNIHAKFGALFSVIL